jgi:hypothetical protein
VFAYHTHSSQTTNGSHSVSKGIQLVLRILPGQYFSKDGFVKMVKYKGMLYSSNMVVKKMTRKRKQKQIVVEFHMQLVYKSEELGVTECQQEFLLSGQTRVAGSERQEAFYIELACEAQRYCASCPSQMALYRPSTGEMGSICSK